MDMKKIIVVLCMALSVMPVFAQGKFERHNFSMNAGYSFKPGEQHPKEFVNMFDNSEQSSRMKHGYELEFDYDYRFHELFSFGFKASMFGSVHGFDKEVLDVASGKMTNKYYSDDMKIFYIGPSFKFQLPTIAEHYDLWCRATLGYMKMQNTDKADLSATYTGSSFGYGLGIGADYKITRFISIGLSASFLSGNVSTLHIGEDKIDISDYEESLSRFNVNIGVRIRL